MALAQRDATVTWEGTIGDGSGTLATGGGAEQRLPMDWAARSEEAEGTTSPEELLAAAEAGCYAMSLALGLTRNGTPAERLEVHGVCALDKTDGEHEYVISRLSLDVKARVPGLEDDRFQEIAHRADEECPISLALRGNVDVTVTATLEG
jgi:osmotically inducible protein OsmC